MPHRFLFLLYFYPPAPGPSPKRNFNISKAIADKAAKSFVLMAPYPGRKIPKVNNMNIRRIPVLDYRYILRLFTKDGYIPEHRKKQEWKQWGIRMINTFPLNILIGEGGLVYFLNLIFTGQRLIKKEHITHIYSSYRPFADHYAAYLLKKRYPRLVWIADFRDLIIDPDHKHIFLSKKHNSFFIKIFKNADTLITVSDGLAMHLKEYNKNVLTIPNGIFDVPENIDPVPAKYFTVSYTGSMSLNRKNAEPLFKALAELVNEKLIVQDDIRIVYAGKDWHQWNILALRYGFENNLDNKGVISSGEAEEIQKGSVINLLLTVSSDELEGVLSGKMIEYFAAGSPVLAIIVNRNDTEIRRHLTELQIGESFSDKDHDLAGIKDFLYKEYLSWKNTGMNRKPVRLDILKEKYSMTAVMKPLFDKIGVSEMQEAL